MLTEILAYLDDMGIVDREERLLFHRYIRVMDSKFLEMSHKKMVSERDRLMNANKQGRNSKGR